MQTYGLRVLPPSGVSFISGLALIVRGLPYAERFLNDGTAGTARNCARAAIAWETLARGGGTTRLAGGGG